MHLDFIIAAANLRAFIFNIPALRDAAMIASKVNAVKVPEFVPRSGITIDVNDSEMQARANAGNGNHESTFDELKKSLPKPGQLAYKSLPEISFFLLVYFV